MNEINDKVQEKDGGDVFDFSVDTGVASDGREDANSRYINLLSTLDHCEDAKDLYNAMVLYEEAEVSGAVGLKAVNPKLYKKIDSLGVLPLKAKDYIEGHSAIMEKLYESALESEDPSLLPESDGSAYQEAWLHMKRGLLFSAADKRRIMDIARQDIKDFKELDAKAGINRDSRKTMYEGMYELRHFHKLTDRDFEIYVDRTLGPRYRRYEVNRYTLEHKTVLGVGLDRFDELLESKDKERRDGFEF